jgi:hypothetical protein
VDAAKAIRPVMRAAPPRDSLYALNHDDMATLAARCGLLMIAARILVARRPFTSISQIFGTLGLTKAQYARIAA